MNNSNIQISEIGESDNALLCYTDNFVCCRALDNRPRREALGDWYYPDGSRVLNVHGSDIYRNRRLMVVRLNRRNNAISPLGRYRCEIPDANGVNQTLYANIIPPRG